jgi:hypothetical protein
MLRDLAYISLFCVLSALAVLTIPVIYVWSVSGCDVHEDYQVSSPAGRWEALVAITGCHGVFLSTTFDTRITIRDTSKTPLNRLPAIFESDAAEAPTLTWTGTNALEVEVRQITEVYQSLRSYKGIRITYRVTPNVIQNIADIESHIGRGRGQLQPADERVDYRRYLSRCRDWIRLYTE